MRKGEGNDLIPGIWVCLFPDFRQGKIIDIDGDYISAVTVNESGEGDPIEVMTISKTQIASVIEEDVYIRGLEGFLGDSLEQHIP